MKLFVISVGIMAITALAAPMSSMINVKRAGLAKRTFHVDDVATTGYATQNGGTSGGRGGKTVEVASLSDLTEAVKGGDAAIILITGPIQGMGENIKVGSNKSVIGKGPSVVLTDFTLTVKGVRNVILRNFAVKKVVDGDAIFIQEAQNVWIDHVDLSSDRDHDKDFYDGLLDVTHAADFVTVSGSFLHDHWKCSLIGRSDSIESEDKSHLTITYNNNYWKNINSRGPSFRFGTGHLHNNYLEDVIDGINAQQGAELLVQNNVFESVSKALYSTDEGFVVEDGNDFGTSENIAPEGALKKVPYKISEMLDASDVKAAVMGSAVVTLFF